MLPNPVVLLVERRLVLVATVATGNADGVVLALLVPATGGGCPVASRMLRCWAARYRRTAGD